MKIAQLASPHPAAGVAALRIARASVYPAGAYRSPNPAIRRSIKALLRVRKMQKLSSVLFTTMISMSIAAFVAESRAQNSTGILPPKTGTRLITLGTRGGPIPMVGRAQSSNVLVINGAIYIVDAGEGVTRRLTRAAIAVRDIDNIFITHPHSDHTGGLGGLLSTEYDYNRTKPVNIYGPPGTDASIKALVQFLTVSADIRISEGMRTAPPATIFFGHDTGTGMIYQDANVKVTAAENSHFNFPPGSPAYGKYKSYSYRFETADRIIVFSGDTGPSAALAELAKGADLLVTEVISVEEWKEQQISTGRWQSMTPEQQARALRRQVEEHITPDEIGKMATHANVKTIVLSHFLPATDPKDEYERLGEQVKKYFSGNVLVAKDLMEF
jgi:ribonuclease BN (tRNA processing enzyme)